MECSIYAIYTSVSKCFPKAGIEVEHSKFFDNMLHTPRWWLPLIVVRRFEYTSDLESYTSRSVDTGRASLAGQVKG